MASPGLVPAPAPPGRQRIANQQLYAVPQSVILQNAGLFLGSGSTPAATDSTSSRTSQSLLSFLKHNYLSIGLFSCLIIALFVIVLMAIMWAMGRTAPSENTKSVAQLFDKTPPTPPPPNPKSEPKTYNSNFRLSDGVPLDANNTAIRVYDLGTSLSDMDMLSIMFFTCCCNDKSIVICDGRSSHFESSLSSPLENYTVACYLSHDPTIPPINNQHTKYIHRWKLIIQVGPAFLESIASTNTDCIFSTTYDTVARPQPPPPKPPPNDMTKKIW